MKITRVEPIGLFVPLEEPIEAPISLAHADELTKVVFPGYRSTLVRIHTDAGITGIGECLVRLAPKATAAIVEELTPVLIGRDPLDREAITEVLYGAMMNRGHHKGFFIEALSGIDMALWDCAGKYLDLPLYTMLGGRHHQKLRAYASSLRFRPFDVVTGQARAFQERGFTAMKIKIGRNVDRPEKDIALVRAIREAVGDEVTLMVDANCAYDGDVATAIRVGRALEELDIYWFEEPLSPDNIKGMAEMANALDIRIAAGEAEFSPYGFRDLFTNRAIDVVQPNISRAGGVTAGRHIAAMSHAFHIPYAPHTGSCSAVCLAATLQFAVALPNFLIFEYMQSDWSASQPNPLRHDLLRTPAEVFKDGHMVVPETPGIGADIDEDVLDNHRVA